MKRKYRKKVPWSLPEPEYSITLATRALEHTVKTETGCMEWQGWCNRKGYGEVGVKFNRNEHVHRVVFRGLRGPIPDGMIICHTCDNRKCINPLHLFPGTIDINNKDMALKGRCKYSKKHWTHCKHGHEFTPENTWIDSRNFRHCRACNRIRLNSPEYKRKSQERQRRRRALKREQKLGAVSESGE
jgi:hypothetical protein